MSDIFFMVQLFFSVIIGLYFLSLLVTHQSSKTIIDKRSKKEMEDLRSMREQSLTIPLSEYIRPNNIDDLVGQEDGLKFLKAALCSSNPQHVLIYGPPGVGKTAVARVILEEAKKSKLSPFNNNSKLIEIDATTLRYDERGIVDPLIGSVHDPIYQGAGKFGDVGIPQPKIGAVTKAHGGILFLDEIGELHKDHMNKLLKVLEDRKVLLESSYYNKEDKNIPPYIHEIFTNGLPADFRLIGATTKSPNDIPLAIRSRCVEIHFTQLKPKEIGLITSRACKKSGLEIDENALEEVKKYANNGREAVNIIQITGGLALTEDRKNIRLKDVQWVLQSGNYSPRKEKIIGEEPSIGYVNALAIYGPRMGIVIDVEASAIKVPLKGQGRIIITGIIEEEERNLSGRIIKKKSTAFDSISNVLTVIRRFLNVDPRDYDIHLNFPGSVPVDGPSVGVAVATAIYSAIIQKPIDNRLAMTGEISIRGYVNPVGEIAAKIEAAREAGCTRVLIPKDNYQKRFEEFDIQIIPIENINQVMEHLTTIKENSNKDINIIDEQAFAGVLGRENIFKN